MFFLGKIRLSICYYAGAEVGEKNTPQLFLEKVGMKLLSGWAGVEPF